MNAKIDCLKNFLKEKKQVAIAYSGGLDSFFLSLMSKEILGYENTVCFFIRTEFMPVHEIESAIDLSEKHRFNLEVLDLKMLDKDDVKANTSQRCYYCKKQILSLIKSEAFKKGIVNILDGTQVDDLKDFRPGMKALQEYGILSPLVNCNFSKQDIRNELREKNIPIWNKPEMACLATRIQYNTEIRKEILELIDKTEYMLYSIGIPEARVRIHNDIARIEVLKPVFQSIMENRERILNMFENTQINHVCLDLTGYRKGSMDL